MTNIDRTMLVGARRALTKEYDVLGMGKNGVVYRGVPVHRFRKSEVIKILAICFKRYEARTGR